MVWFRVDDALHDHRKARKAGAHAMGLWALAGSWCGANPSDGFVPESVVVRWEPKVYKRLAGRLVDAELWDVAELDGEAGWQFRNWSEFQPTKAEIEAEKAAARQRMKDRRARLKGVAKTDGSPDVQANTQGTNDERGTDVREVFEDPGPYRPVPARTEPGKEPSSEIAEAITDDEPTRDDVEEVCEHLADRIQGNGANRPRVTKTWRKAARLMIDVDKRTVEQIHAAIDWCQDDQFWRGNVLSMPKLRERYEQLRLAALNSAKASRPSTTDARVADGIALAQRLREQENAAGTGPIYIDGPHQTPAIGATA